MPDALFNIRIDEEDKALLDAVAAAEKLTRSDIVRRAVRAYAKKLGVEAPTPKKRPAKKKRVAR